MPFDNPLSRTDMADERANENGISGSGDLPQCGSGSSWCHQDWPLCQASHWESQAWWKSYLKILGGQQFQWVSCFSHTKSLGPQGCAFNIEERSLDFFSVQWSPHRQECWVDPRSLNAQRALETIGGNLQRQYERYTMVPTPNQENYQDIVRLLKRQIHITDGSQGRAIANHWTPQLKRW